MDSIYMKSAIAEAEKAYAEGETPVGAVIVRDGEIIASAHNMTERLNDSTAHAELLAIQAAEKATGDRRLTGCALYVTMEPCPMCAGAALNSRIEEIVFGAWDPEMGSCGSRTDVTDGRLPRRAKTMGGVLEEDCQRLLRDFFREKRGKELVYCVHIMNFRRSIFVFNAGLIFLG